MNTKPFLLGSENENSVSAEGGRRSRQMPSEVLAELFTDAVRTEFPCLPDAGSSGVFLQNGGRLYNDINGHPEYCTPECSTPEQVAAYDIAGERIMQRLATRIRDTRKMRAVVIKNNLGCLNPDSITFGNHESYLCWVPLSRAAAALIPHLVTRLPYAGAGCLSSHPGGEGIELSQRARHLVQVMGSETTHNRAIFCDRIRTRKDAGEGDWVRAHLIAKDSHRSPLGTYLTFGTTGLLFWILNQGGRVGEGLELAEPVQALRCISLDPWLRVKVKLADGRRLTALEIQQELLAQCEAFVARHALPDWGPRVLQIWSETLQRLATNPLTLASQLDAYAKLAIFQHELSRANCKGSELRDSLKLLNQLRREFGGIDLVRAVVSEDPSGLETVERQAYDAAMSNVHSAGKGAIDRLRFALRLSALDLKYHELGGLYDQMSEAGHMENRVVSESEIAAALVDAPPGGRAALRSALIKEHHGQPGWSASWEFVHNSNDGTAFDMSNPFETERRVMSTADSEPSGESEMRRHHRRLMERILRF